MKYDTKLIQAVSNIQISPFTHLDICKLAGTTDSKAYHFLKAWSADGKITRIKVGRKFAYINKACAPVQPPKTDIRAILKKDIGEALGLKATDSKDLTGLQNQCIYNIEQARQKVNDHYHVNIEMPVVYFDLKGDAAGKASYSANIIRINPVLLKENPERVSVQTALHEFAHIASFVIAGYRRPMPHGKEWKAVMRYLGLKPEVHHNMDVSNCARTQKRFKVKCSCMTHMVTKRALNKIKADPSYYSCKKCKEHLVTA